MTAGAKKIHFGQERNRETNTDKFHAQLYDVSLSLCPRARQFIAQTALIRRDIQFSGT